MGELLNAGGCRDRPAAAPLSIPAPPVPPSQRLCCLGCSDLTGGMSGEPSPPAPAYMGGAQCGIMARLGNAEMGLPGTIQVRPPLIRDEDT